jgi:uncharacterized protein
LKADRETGTLRANAIHHEEMVDPAETASAMSGELVKMAEWLGLPNVEVKKSGNLSAALLKYF